MSLARGIPMVLGRRRGRPVRQRAGTSWWSALVGALLLFGAGAGAGNGLGADASVGAARTVSASPGSPLTVLDGILRDLPRGKRWVGTHPSPAPSSPTAVLDAVLGEFSPSLGVDLHGTLRHSKQPGLSHASTAGRFSDALDALLPDLRHSEPEHERLPRPAPPSRHKRARTWHGGWSASEGGSSWSLSLADTLSPAMNRRGPEIDGTIWGRPAGDSLLETGQLVPSPGTGWQTMPQTKLQSHSDDSSSASPGEWNLREQRLELDDPMDIVHQQGLDVPVLEVNGEGVHRGGFEEFASLGQAISKLNDLNDRRASGSRAGSKGRERLQIFAREVNAKGARVFVVADASDFFKTYRTLEYTPNCRHFYEILLEGQPCRLYMDLEFPINTSSSGGESSVGNGTTPYAEAVARGNSLVAELLEAMTPLLTDALAHGRSDGMGAAGVSRMVQAVELDATTDSKFSRHLIFPGLVVANTSHAGALVRALAANVSAEAASIIDFAVYSRNRCFRLVGSTKFAKTNPFQVLRWRDPVGKFAMHAGERREGHRRGEASANFLETLASFVPVGERVLENIGLDAEGGRAIRLALDIGHGAHDLSAMPSDGNLSQDAQRLVLAEKAVSGRDWRIVPGGGGGGGGGGIRAPAGYEKLVEWVCGEVRPGAALAYVNVVAGYALGVCVLCP